MRIHTPWFVTAPSRADFQTKGDGSQLSSSLSGVFDLLSRLCLHFFQVHPIPVNFVCTQTEFR